MHADPVPLLASRPPVSPDATVRPVSPVMRWLAGLVVLAIALIVGTTWRAIHKSQIEQRERATIAAQNLSLVLEQSITAVIDKVDLTLRLAALDVKRQREFGGVDALPVTELLAQHQLLVPELDALRIADAAGFVRYGRGVPGGAPINIADRDYFIRLSDDAGAGLVVYGPVVSRITGKWAIVLARRIARPDGSLAGIIYAVIGVERFQHLFSAMNLGASGALTLSTLSLDLVARHPFPQRMPDPTGTRSLSPELQASMQSDPQAGNFFAVSALDGIERDNVYRKFKSYPFYIFVGLAPKDYLAAWRAEALRNTGLAVLAVLLTLGAAGLVGRAWERQSRAATALARESYRNQLLLRTASDGIHVLDAEGRVLEANDAFCAMLGYTRSELLQMSVAQWDARWSAAELQDKLAQILGSKSASVFDTRHRRRDGSVVDVEISAAGVALDGSSVIYASARDITERKRSQAALIAATAEARRANQAKSRFLATASHDLRQPLWALSLYVEMLTRQRAPENAELVASIQECVASLSELLNDLLDVSKLEAGVVAPECVDFAIDELLSSLTSVHAAEAKLKGLRLRCRCRGAMVHTDPMLLRRLLGNLVANAICYTERGGVLIACRRRQGKLWVEVWDTGVGIPGDKTTVVFEEFTQLAGSSRSRGSGLGLAIVAKTAKLLGLELRLRSEPGRGSMFAIELPPARVASAPASSPAAIRNQLCPCAKTVA